MDHKAIIDQKPSLLLAGLQKCVLRILSVGPIPNHIGFIMDGNRRFAKKRNLVYVSGHRFGMLALVFILKYCLELGVKYVTVFGFSIDNFRRKPEEIQAVMDTTTEMIEMFFKSESIIHTYKVKVLFIGDLKLLSEPVRLAAEKLMLATASNSNFVLSVCMAYTSTDEITHGVQESCKEKCEKNDEVIRTRDIAKHLYMGVAPEADIIVRTSGETRLSNFLLWQSDHCYLDSPSVLWPDIGFRHFVWTVLNFQKHHFYLEKTRNQA